MLIVILSIYFVLSQLWTTSVSLRALLNQISTHQASSRLVENAALNLALKNCGVKIYSSETISVPMATCFKAIFIPAKLIKELPQNEFEAMIAHELEHIRWKDPLFRLLLQWISALFWWVPTFKWKKSLELDQEVACDQMIVTYGLERASLASALIKVARMSRETAIEALCYFYNAKHPSFIRLELMLGLAAPCSKYFDWLSYTVIALGVGIGMICYW